MDTSAASLFRVFVVPASRYTMVSIVFVFKREFPELEWKMLPLS